jgi:RNA polymerase sigma-54 factor
VIPFASIDFGVSMQLGMQQNTSMRLDQKLAPQMIMSINLLQANTLELETMIQQEILVNPLLEIADDSEDGPLEDFESMENADDRSDSDNHVDGEEYVPPEDRAMDIDHDVVDERIADDSDWEKLLKDTAERAPRDGEDLSKPAIDETWERVQTYSVTLEDHLIAQLHDRKLTPEMDTLVRWLIDLLDDDGYLRSPPSDATKPQVKLEAHQAEIEALLRNEIALEESSLPVREALHVLQMLDPPGIGARNLQECLLLQAWRRDDISDQGVEILEKYFDLFIELEYEDIGKAMKISAERVKQIVLSEIAHLHLKPGVLAACDTAPTKVPDLMVVENELGELEVRLNDGTLPRLRVSKTYSDLLTNPHTSSKDKKYIREKMKAADMLIRSVGQRKATMIKVMTAIVARQKAFFYKGVGSLRPMILQDIAEEIGMHISTVNRVTNGKYVQTDWGIFEIKAFFTAGVIQEDGHEISSSVAKEAIKRLLATEPKSKPYSDDQIVKLLEERDGLKLARRTVSKYREAMGYLPSRIRKKL